MKQLLAAFLVASLLLMPAPLTGPVMPSQVRAWTRERS
jgi:hypothetical protein